MAMNDFRSVKLASSCLSTHVPMHRLFRHQTYCSSVLSIVADADSRDLTTKIAVTFVGRGRFVRQIHIFERLVNELGLPIVRDILVLAQVPRVRLKSIVPWMNSRARALLGCISYFRSLCLGMGSLVCCCSDRLVDCLPRGSRLVQNHSNYSRAVPKP